MSVWLFQANKQEYDLLEKVPPLLGGSDWWSVKQHVDKMKRDDIALFWQSGEDAGIYATGKLISEPYFTSSHATDDHRVNVTYDQLLAVPLLRNTLTDHPVLRDLDVVNRPWGRNAFRVDDAEWSALQSLMSELVAGMTRHHPDTAKVAKPIDGDKAYQERARRALPLLVRQAHAGVPMYYSDFADEIGMANPRNLNFVLASIGQSLERLSSEWKEPIPPIQCLVVNKETGLPGEGIGWFLLKEKDFKKLSMRQKREVVQAELQRIYRYRRWRDVLNSLSLEPAEPDYSGIVEKAGISSRIGGESLQHKMLKAFVANHPEVVGLKSGTSPGKTEELLPSGDCLDVSFVRRNLWVAAEVKSSISDENDMVRGMFQCVKYLAVMEAKLSAEARPQNARAVLVLEGALPPHLVPLKNLLGVEVIEGIRPTPIGSEEGVVLPRLDE